MKAYICHQPMGNTMLELSTFKYLMEVLNSAASSWKHANALITLGPSIWQFFLAYRWKQDEMVSSCNRKYVKVDYKFETLEYTSVLLIKTYL